MSKKIALPKLARDVLLLLEEAGEEEIAALANTIYVETSGEKSTFMSELEMALWSLYRNEYIEVLAYGKRLTWQDPELGHVLDLYSRLSANADGLFVWGSSTVGSASVSLTPTGLSNVF